MENRFSDNMDHRERGEVNVENLYLDQVVASNPEIGPTPPDGGYGWLVVVAAVIYHITVPTVLSVYGFIILKAIREEDHDEGEFLRIWDVNLALIPIIMVVIRLLLESWCRAIVKIFNMPRFTALSGLCLTTAGVLLSSYSTDANSNDHIVNIFSGIFIGAGCALTGQQTEVLITNYFKDKLTMVQRIVRMAPSIGNCLVPLLVGYLSTIHTGDVVVMIYGAVMMQNCIFLASYTRPIYIERVIRNTYNMIRDAVEDDDEVIFSNQNRSSEPQSSQAPQTSAAAIQEEDGADIIVFKSKTNAKEILDPSIEYRDKITNSTNRFSSDFSSIAVVENEGASNRFSSNFNDIIAGPNRFSSDYDSLNVNNYGRVGYQELENIENAGENPQPLYRETTVNAPQNTVIFPAEISSGTARRTASLKKNLITISNMLLDVNFYLYTLLHLCTTFSVVILSVVFPPMVWEQNPSMNIWSVSLLTAVAHAAALCFIMLCIALPKNINEKAKLCAAFCLIGALGFYGITISGNKTVLVVWCMLASVSTSASHILLQPLYNSTLNDFDTTATMTAANVTVAALFMAWCLAYNYTYKTCFWIATILQIITASAFFISSIRRRR